MRRLPLRSLALAIAFAAAFAPRAAFAEDKRTEAAAKDAIKKANADYAASAYDKAADRLQKAAKACGDKKCTPGTKAAVLRDLGALQLKGGDADAAMASFAGALKLDPNLEPSATIDAPGLRDAWNAAKDEATIGEQPWGGDFVHVPVSEQVVRTSVPVYVELAAGEPPAHVYVKYKAAGTSEYKRVELSKKGKGWGVLLPCGASTRGVLRYYVQGFDSKGESVANGGEPSKPYAVRIRPKISSAPPSLPDSPPPKQCSESAASSSGASGTSTGGGDSESETPDEGDKEKKKPKSDEKYSRVWIGVLGSVDFTSLSAANDVCRLNRFGQPGNTPAYYCTNTDGTDFPSRVSTGENNTLTPGSAGQAGGGFATGNIRVMASIDYALSASFLMGLRAGWTFRTYPGEAAKNDGLAAKSALHLELRGTLLFGDEPLANLGLAPYVFFGGGRSEFDASTQVTVTQSGIPGTKTLDAWATRGPWFVALGGGARYALSKSAAFMLGLKLAGAFGSVTFQPIASPELALQFGF